MLRIFFWVCFVVLMVFSENLDTSHYFLFSGLMLYIVYLLNQVNPFKMSLRNIVSVLFIPDLMFWYISFVYNDFLSLAPIEYEVVVFLFLVHTYLLLYIFMEYSVL